MQRPRTDKFAIQTKGLSVDQAAQLAYIVSCAAQAFAGDSNYEFACSVPVRELRRLFPAGQWTPRNASDRRKLVE